MVHILHQHHLRYRVGISSFTNGPIHDCHDRRGCRCHGRSYRALQRVWTPNLGYLGVPEDQRNKGLGAEVLSLLHKRYSDARGIIAEAEAPEAAANEDERTLRQRRLGFYARCGFVTMPFDCGLFGVHYKTLLLPNGEVDEEEALQVQLERYREHFKPEHFQRYVQLPLREGEEIRPFSKWID